jgi:hypothetical protein
VGVGGAGLEEEHPGQVLWVGSTLGSGGSSNTQRNEEKI